MLLVSLKYRARVIVELKGYIFYIEIEASKVKLRLSRTTIGSITTLGSSLLLI